MRIDNGYVWGHYGITLEAKGKQLDERGLRDQAEELRDQAEEAYRNAIKLRPDFVSVHAALARIYTKKEPQMQIEADRAKELAQRCCVD